ncbi:tape measure protein [Microbacterium phage Milani]|nr:tape measure protein [Microbacterium phage Milani]
MALDIGTLVAKIKVDDGDFDKKTDSWSTKGAAIGSAFGNVAADAISQVTSMLGDFVGEAMAASDATQKFEKTLGFAGLDTSTIDKLRKSTQAYADETVYSLSDIQSITATLAANGVEGYDSLAMSLGNLNAVAGGNAETFGRVGSVLTQTAGQGKLTTENWNQLTDAIPGAAGKLMDALLQAGAYTGNFREAMEKGEITAEEFNAAIQLVGSDPIAVEAAKSVETFEGSAGNLAAVIQSKLVTAIDAVKPVLVGMTNAAADFFDNIGAWTPLIAGLGAVIFAAMLPAIISATVATWAFTVALLANPITWVVLAIGALVAGIVWLIQNWDTAVSFITTIWSGFITWITGVIDGFLAWWNGIWAAVGQFFTDTWSNLSSWASGVWSEIASFFQSIWQGVVDVWNAVWQAIVDFVTPIVEFIAGLIQTYIDIYVNVFLIFAAVLKTIWEGISNVVTTVWNAIVSFLTPIITGISDFVQSTFRKVQAFWSAVWSAISSFFRSIWDGIVSFLTPIINRVSSTIQAVIATVQSVWNTVWSSIGSFFSSIWQGMVDFFTPIINRVSSTISATIVYVQSIWNSTWSNISSFFSGIWQGMVSGVQGAVGSIMDVVGSIWGKIMGAFSGAGNWLFSMGRNIIEGLVNGIKSMVSGVINAVSDVVNGAIDWAKDTLGIASPSKLFRQFGIYVGEGLIDGLEKMEDPIDAEFRRIVQAPDVEVPGVDGGDGTGGPGNRPGTGGGDFHYHAAERQSLSSEEALFEALSGPRSPYGR